MAGQKADQMVAPRAGLLVVQLECNQELAFASYLRT
jgi:hypothetical protein